MLGRRKRVSAKEQLRILIRNDPQYLEARHVNDYIGKGLFTNQLILRGQYVGEYKGRSLTAKEVEDVQNDTFLYTYKFNGKLHGIDASDDFSGILRYANDEWENPNTRMEKAIIDGKPHLFLKAARNIPANTEIRYDYNVPDAPWRKGQGGFTEHTVTMTIPHGSQAGFGFTVSGDFDKNKPIDEDASQLVSRTSLSAPNLAQGRQEQERREEEISRVEKTQEEEESQLQEEEQASQLVSGTLLSAPNLAQGRQEQERQEEEISEVERTQKEEESQLQEERRKSQLVSGTSLSAPNLAQGRQEQERQEEEISEVERTQKEEESQLQEERRKEERREKEKRGENERRKVEEHREKQSKEDQIIWKQEQREQERRMSKEKMKDEDSFEEKRREFYERRTEQAAHHQRLEEKEKKLQAAKERVGERLKKENRLMTEERTKAADSYEESQRRVEERRSISKHAAAERQRLEVERREMEDEEKEAIPTTSSAVGALPKAKQLIDTLDEYETSSGDEETPCQSGYLQVHRKGGFFTEIERGRKRSIPSQHPAHFDDSSDDNTDELDDPSYSASEVSDSCSEYSSSTSCDPLAGLPRRQKKYSRRREALPLSEKRAFPAHSFASDKKKRKGEQDDMVSSTSFKVQDDRVSPSSVRVLYANNRKRRKWDKRQSCLYCEKLVPKLPRHLETHHKDETSVQEVLSLPKKSKSRANLLKILQNEGNHKHNISVLEAGSGNVIPVKRPASADVNYREYLPCDECLGWYLACDMWKHKKNCIVGKKSTKKYGKNLKSRCSMILPMAESATRELRETVLNRMMFPCPITLAVRNDDLICKMGTRVLRQTKASSSNCFQTVSQKMREMARLLIRLRKENPELTMKDCIDPKMFDRVIDAVRQEAGYDEETGKYATPSLALKLGNSLGMCATLCRAEGIKQEDKVMKTKAEDFQDLCKSEWRVEVSKSALQNLEEKHWNAPPAIPVTSEVTRVRQFVSNTIKEKKAILRQDPNPSSKDYASLAQGILADLVMFNRRRSGEVQRLKLEDISKAKSGDTNPDIMRCLSQWEQQLCRELTRLEIRGKKGRKVPILLTREMSENIDFLKEMREDAGVKEDNPYLFAIPEYDTCFRGSDCLRKFAKASEVKHPEYITSTRLRKHVAVMSQLVSLKENELDVLATFMGHDIRVHRNYYRLPEDTLQTAKVAKLLILAEKEKLASCAGKSLDDIDLEEPCHEIADEEELDEKELDDDEACGETLHERRGADGMSTGSEDDAVHQKDIQKEAQKKMTWSEKEGAAVDAFFASHVSKMQVPRKHECMECKCQNPILKRVDWKKIKFRVHNKISVKKRIRKGFF